MAYPPGDVTVGRDAIRALWEQVLANAPTFEPEPPLPTLVSGDIAPPARSRATAAASGRRSPAARPMAPGCGCLTGRRSARRCAPVNGLAAAKDFPAQAPPGLGWAKRLAVCSWPRSCPSRSWPPDRLADQRDAADPPEFLQFWPVKGRFRTWPPTPTDNRIPPHASEGQKSRSAISSRLPAGSCGRERAPAAAPVAVVDDLDRGGLEALAPPLVRQRPPAGRHVRNPRSMVGDRGALEQPLPSWPRGRAGDDALSRSSSEPRADAQLMRTWNAPSTDAGRRSLISMKKSSSPGHPPASMVCPNTWTVRSLASAVATTLLGANPRPSKQ